MLYPDAFAYVSMYAWQVIKSGAIPVIHDALVSDKNQPCKVRTLLISEYVRELLRVRLRGRVRVR